MHFKSPKLHLLVLLNIFLAPLLKAYTTAFHDHVANSYLNTFKVVNAKEIAITQESIHRKTFSEHIRQLFSPRDLGLAKLGPREMIELDFKKTQKNPDNGSIIDTHFVDKMEIVKNSNENSSQSYLMYYLTKDFNDGSYLQTMIGRKRFVEMISQPTNDVSLLKKRQQIIQELVNNDALRTKCSAILKEMQQAEPLFYDLHMKELQGIEIAFYFGDFFNKLNKPAILSAFTRFSQFGGSITTLAAPATLAGAFIYRQKLLHAYTALRTHTPDFDDIKTVVIGIYSGILSPIFSLLSSSVLKQQINALLNMQERLIGVSTYISGIKKITHMLKSNSTIRALMPELSSISRELHYSKQRSDEFNKLNHLLTKSTFKGSPSFFSSIGTILMAYKYIMQEYVRLEYTDIKNKLGELDVYVALAQKIKTHQERIATFCFVQFVHNVDQPMIHAINFWNPFIDPSKVVVNTVILNDGTEHNIILTGPNTGGKSTFMKALMHTILLAQTFGIAPAQSLTITPFEKLLAYLNIADDTGAGISLFKAEVQRAQELMTTLRSLKPHEFAFVIIDEIFTGTIPEKAEELSYKFIKKMSEFKNCLFIDATHFKKLVDLEHETNGVCKNYHTGVVLDPADPSKVAHYTYKLTQGPSPINNAEQVADEAGIFDF